MTQSQGARAGLSFIPEVTFGTTPATPAMASLPFNTHTLDLKKTSLTSQQIRSDRQIEIFRHGQRNVDGSIAAELRAIDFDHLLESALFNAFTTTGNGTLKDGVTLKSFTIEESNLDITQFRQFLGCTVGSMAIECKPNQMVMGTFNFQGKDMTVGTSTVASSLAADSGNQPFDSFTATITEGGASSAIITGCTINVDNSTQPSFAIGSQTTAQMEYGMSNVTGEITAYFKDAALLNKFVNETTTSIVLALIDSVSSHTYTITLPKVKYSGAALPVNNPQSRILTLPFQALYDSSNACTIKIVKS